MKKKTFQELQAEWYLKLARGGFKDLENAKGSLKADPYVRSINDHLRDRNRSIGLKARIAQSKIRNLTREQYYSRASEFLDSYKKFQAGDKRLWELHAQGLSYRNICKAICSYRYKSKSRMAIYYRLEPIIERMLSGKWDLGY